MPDLWVDVDVALAEVPVNILPLTDDTDFKSQETAVAYNAAGMALKWNFVDTAGNTTQTAVTPTSAGVYDWAHQGGGMYTIEIPASGGGSINNDTEGVGWFTGICTGVLSWRGPTVGFRAAGLNDKLIDSAYDTTRGLAGTALPSAAAEAAGGLYTRGSGAGQITQDANGRINVNVKAYGDSAGTFSGGRPEVNTTHAAGTAWGSGAITAASIAADAITDAKVAADVTIASVTGSVGSVAGNVGGSIGSLGATAKSDVNAEVVDALNVDTYAEPGQEAPPATTTLVKKIGYLFKLARNRITQDTTTLKIYADDATTVDQKATVSDNGTTYDRGEIASGP